VCPSPTTRRRRRKDRCRSWTPRLFPDPSDQEADGGLRVLTIAEVAERLRVDKRSVRRAIVAATW